MIKCKFLLFKVFWIYNFWLFLAIFVHFLGCSGDLGGLGVLVSYMITRGIRLVVGGSLKGFGVEPKSLKV